MARITSFWPPTIDFAPLSGPTAPPEPGDEDAQDAYAPPPIGIHPLLDIMAMQWWIIRQQRDIWGHFTKVHRQQRIQALLWLAISAMLFVASLPGAIQAWHLFFH